VQTSKFGAQCLSWVIFVGSTRFRRSRHVRFAPISSEPSHRSESSLARPGGNVTGMNFGLTKCDAGLALSCQEETFESVKSSDFQARVHLDGPAAVQITTGNLPPIRDQCAELLIARVDSLGKLVPRSDLGDDILADFMDGVQH
jgi:hypothetical protein